jgi:hypothetical protein
MADGLQTEISVTIAIPTGSSRPFGNMKGTMKMSRSSCAAIFMFTALVTVGSPAAPPATDADDQERAAIRKLVAKINQAWSSPEKATLIQEVPSDESFCFAMPKPSDPSRALIMSKTILSSLIERKMRTDPPRERRHDPVVA